MEGKRTAWLAGGTGLVGGFLLRALETAPEYGKVHAITRGVFPVSASAKLHVKVVKDLATVTADALGDCFPVDDVYCALGTTIAKAGSQEAFRRVDFEAVVRVAESAKTLGAKTFAVVSSVGAESTAGNFYLRTKGEMERAVAQIGFARVIIARPSLLLGPRQEKRTAERSAIAASKFVAPLLVGGLQKYRPVQASDVAAALVNATIAEPSVESNSETVVLHYSEIMQAAKRRRY